MSENKCKNNAEIAIPWAGKILKGCPQHANGICVLANAMGTPIEARKLPPNKDKCEFADDLNSNNK